MNRNMLKGSFGQRPSSIAERAERRSQKPEAVSHRSPVSGAFARFVAIGFTLAFVLFALRGGCEGIVSVMRGEPMTMKQITKHFDNRQAIERAHQLWNDGKISATEFFEIKGELEAGANPDNYPVLKTLPKDGFERKLQYKEGISLYQKARALRELNRITGSEFQKVKADLLKCQVCPESTLRNWHPLLNAEIVRDSIQTAKGG